MIRHVYMMKRTMKEVEACGSLAEYYFGPPILPTLKKTFKTKQDFGNKSVGVEMH